MLSESTGQYVDAIYYTVKFVRATTLLSYETYAWESSTITIASYSSANSQIAGKVRDVPIHRKDAIGCDEPKSGILGLFKLGSEVVHVVVAISKSLRFAKSNAIDDARMIQLIGKDGILRPQNGLKQPSVGIPARIVKNGVLFTEELADFRLEAFVNALCSTINRTEARP